MDEVKITLVRRTVDAPDKEYLSRAEAAKWIGVGTKLFDILVKDFPVLRPCMLGASKKFWHWSQIFAFIQTRNLHDAQAKP